MSDHHGMSRARLAQPCQSRRRPRRGAHPRPHRSLARPIVRDLSHPTLPATMKPTASFPANCTGYAYGPSTQARIGDGRSFTPDRPPSQAPPSGATNRPDAQARGSMRKTEARSFPPSEGPVIRPHAVGGPPTDAVDRDRSGPRDCARDRPSSGHPERPPCCIARSTSRSWSGRSARKRLKRAPGRSCPQT